MEIRVFDKSLNYIGIVETYSSLQWNRKYFEPGNFELHADMNKSNLELLQHGNIITIAGYNEAGVIENVNNNDTEGYKEITRSGRFLSSYFSRRIINGTTYFNGTVESVMRSCVNAVTAVPNVVFGDLRGFTETVSTQITYKNLLNVLIKLGKSSGLGFRIYPDFTNKLLIFEVYKGIDRTLTQSDNNRVVFSENRDNINEAVYGYNSQLYKNYATIGGAGEGSDRIFTTVGEQSSGLDLYEMFIDAKDLQPEEGMSNSDYTALLQQRGYEKLAENFASENLEVIIMPDIGYVYRTDYDLGDIVTIRKESWRVEIVQRITEISEIYENGVMEIKVTVGSVLPTTFSIDEGE